MKREHLRLVSAGTRTPRKQPLRQRKSILAEIERLSEYLDAMRFDYNEEFTAPDTKEKVRARIADLVREILARAPRSVGEAADVAMLVQSNRYDLPEVQVALKNLAAFYASHLAWTERMAAKHTRAD